ncbi:MAG TPA: site-2 protease family protein [Candidatus Solibacter sp.]|jgi:Zn-dependent protease|nr:site-2 protease family protein [Candidatus Solibacter sp.]
MNTDYLIAGVVWYIVFLLSTTCHEAAHAFAARFGGDPTAFHGGQASLDPLPHIRREPFGMVVFPILSYALGGWMMGWASAPYDPLWSLRYPRRAAWMSLAGPGANFTLAILAAILIHAGILTGVFTPPESANFMHVAVAASSGTSSGAASGAATFLSLMFSLNLLLGTFNLIPVPPLDGFAALGLLLPENGARRLQELGHSIRQFTIIGLMIAWRIFDPLFEPLFALSLRALYPGQNYGR